MPLPDPNPYLQMVRDGQSSAVSSLIDAQDTNPDDAVRSIQVGQATGLPPQLVDTDRESYERELKVLASQAFVKKNGALEAYLNSDPMAAKVSHDDLGNLDVLSEAVAKHNQKSIIVQGLKGFAEGFGEEAPGSWSGATQEDLSKYDRFGGWRLLGLLPEFTFRVGSGFMTALARAGQTAAIQAGIAPDQAKASADRALQVVGDPGMWASIPDIGPALEATVGAMAHNAMLKRATREAKVLQEYGEAGKVPPVGAAEVSDDYHRMQAEMDKSSLAEVIKSAQASATKERSPDMLADFIRQHEGNREIGISADAFRQIYGEKPPHPEDNILGWAPDAVEQWMTSSLTGADFKVPFADYITKINPAVHKQIEDFVRSREEGMTVEEAKAPPKVEAYHGSPYEFDAFDMSKIGAGEGAQSYGHGLYFAEAPDVAQTYAKKLSSPTGGAGAMTSAGMKLSDFKEPQLYKVHIHANKEDFLDWDKPLGEQPVGQKLLATMPEQLRTVLEDDLENSGHSTDLSVYTGGKFHRLLERAASEGLLPTADDKFIKSDVSKYLSQQGIPGIKYLDRASRDRANRIADAQRVMQEAGGLEDIGTQRAQQILAEEGGKGLTHNLVLFSADPIEIISKNGEAVRSIRESASLEPKAPPPKQLELPIAGTTRMEDRPVFAGASPGITAAMTERYQRLIAERTAEDSEYYRKKYEEAERRTQTREWKDRKAALRPDAVTRIKTDPAFVAEGMLQSGDLRFDPQYLSPEEQAALPKKFQKKGGANPEDLAEVFNVKSGSEVVGKIAAIKNLRDEFRGQPAEFTRKMIDVELDRMMEAEFGDLAKNIMEEAHDHVLSATQEELLHEQTLGLAMAAGEQYPINPRILKETLLDHLSKLNAAGMKASDYLAAAGRAGRALETAALKGDIAEQFRQSQAQQMAFIGARYVAQVEKTKADFGKLAKKYSKREVKGTDAEYTNAIHDILQKVGLSIGRRPEDLAREVEAGGYGSVAAFVEHKEKMFESVGVQMPVADFLLQDKVTPYKDMSVYEFNGLNQSMKVLDHMGRMEEKINIEGAKADRKEWVSNAVKQLADKFGIKGIEAQPAGVAKTFFKKAIAVSHSLDTIWERFDSRDPNGMFTKMFLYPSHEAANERDKMQREFAQKYRAIGEVKDVDRAVAHNFVDKDGRKFVGFTRGTLDAIISNIGNKYNLERMAFTLNTTPANLLAWVEKVSTPEDLARAQARGDLFAELKKRSDTVYRNIYGTAPEDIVLQPVAMHGQQYPGWYHPIIPDSERSLRDHSPARDSVTRPTTFWPSTPNSYTKRRTGAFEYLSLNNELIPVMLSQVIHDISMRDFVWNTAKIINDREFRDGVTKTYGKEYHEIMKQWLDNLAGNQSYNNGALGGTGVRVSNFFRQNVISTYIAFNLGTIFKHAPTAAVMSAAEIGFKQYIKSSGLVYADWFAHAARGLFNADPARGESIWSFVKNNFEEIQRRDRNWMDTMGGAHDIIYGKDTWRSRIMQWGAHGVALSDMLSAVPMAYGKYLEVMDRTGGDHAQSVREANQAVVNAHGSTSEASRPVIASQGGALAPWMTSLYGFFGANMQRKIELLHDLNDAYKLGREGEIKQMAGMTPAILGKTFAYVIWPAIVEEMVTGQFTDDRRGLGTKAADFALHSIFNSVIGIRDMTWAFTHESTPSVGLISAPLQDLSNVVKDFGRDRPFSRDHAGKMIQDTLTAFGDVTGASPKAFARPARYLYDVSQGVQWPHGWGDWYRGLESGKQKMRIVK